MENVIKIDGQEKNRLVEIDVIIGIGICLVVVAHMAIPIRLSQFIFAFHMPLFIFASGLVWKKKQISNIIKSTLIPFYSFGILLTVLWYGLLGNNEDIQYQIVNVIGGGVMPIFELMQHLLCGFYLLYVLYKFYIL